MKTLLSLLVILGTSTVMADNGSNGANQPAPEVTEEQQIAEAAHNCVQDAYEDRAKITENFSVPVVDGVAQLTTTVGGSFFRCIFHENGVLAGVFKSMDAKEVTEYPGDKNGK